MEKRDFLKGTAALAAAAFVPHGYGREPRTSLKTYAYKTAGTCVLKADVYSSGLDARRPVILWIHGGALIFGSRKAPPAWLNPDGRYVVVSMGYRLAPETKLPAIIDDLRDAYRWLRDQGPRLFHIDPDRICVAGESAGGYLTLMTGFTVAPRPRVLLSLSGYGDIALPWYSRPSPFYLAQPLVSKEDALASVGPNCVSEPPEKGDHRYDFYLYCRQHGIWPKEVTGHDPDTENKWFDPYCPIRNVSQAYPPTLLIHGSHDTDVPYSESVRMDEKLSQMNVKHTFLRVPGGSHCLEDDPLAVKAPVFRQAMDFVKKEL